MKFYRDSTVADVAQYFNQIFPYLKLSFYASTHSAKTGSKNEELIEPTTCLEELSHPIEEYDFIMDPSSTVADVEQMLFKNFGWNVQVFRQSSDVWLQTVTTDSWTLQEQNQKGQQYTESEAIAPIRVTDFDMN
jgi:hypothetical protein